MSNHHNEIVDNIKTLDEAKRLILHLLESQENINRVLSYEFRTPLTVIYGYAEIAQRENWAQELPYFLKIIARLTERLGKLIDFLRNETRIGWHLHQKSLLEDFPIETVDPNPILTRSIGRIQKSIDLENEVRSQQNEMNKKKSTTPDKRPIHFTTLRTNEDLPTVQFNPATFESIMSDVNWFLSESYRDDIFLTTSFDEEWVKVSFGYVDKNLSQQLMDDYHQFETELNPHEYYGDSRLLYNIWRIVRAYSGELSINIQEKSQANNSSKLEVKMSFKR